MRYCKMILGGAAAGLICSLAFGQADLSDLGRPMDNQALTAIPTRVSVPPLEGPIDPEQYRMGPGDIIEFSVWGGIEQVVSASVSADGKIAIPNVGVIAVAGMTLAEAESLTVKTAVRVYPHSRISLRLVGIRRMSVSISGTVIQPGVYSVSAVDRLSTLILMAGGFPYPQPPEEIAGDKSNVGTRGETPPVPPPEQSIMGQPSLPEASLRHIIITHRDGSVEQVDYLRFQRTGNRDFNLFLSDGDQVQVPALDKTVGVLNVFGAVKIPDEYEFIAGDRVMDLIELAGGFTEDAKLNAVEIVRFNGTADKSGTTRADLEGWKSGERGPSLQPDDRIFVRSIPEYRVKRYVKVTGEVEYPGIYPIEEGQVKLTDIIATCGGFTNQADLVNARVVRLNASRELDSEFERLSELRPGEMDQMEYGYYKIKARAEAPSAVVNFRKLFSENQQSLDILLQDGDEIAVPRIELAVTVMGQVNHPGVVKYEPGKNYKYYIEQAGGYSWSANHKRIRLIKALDGLWIKPKSKTVIDIGDIIFVPGKPETSYWVLSKDLLLVISQLLTAFAVIRTL